jgi:hypothetical protein
MFLHTHVVANFKHGMRNGTSKSPYRASKWLVSLLSAFLFILVVFLRVKSR